MSKILSAEELGDKVCEYCKYTNYGEEDYHGEMKYSPDGFYGCEGSFCDEAYEYYLNHYEEEEEDE